MPVRIRLSRGGAKKRPFYRIVVADSRRSRDGKFLDQIGTYNPMLSKDNPDRVKIDTEKAKDWIKKGAQPSDRLKIFLSNLDIVEKPIITEKTKKHLPKKKDKPAAEVKDKPAAEAKDKPAAEVKDKPADKPAAEVKDKPAAEAKDKPADKPAAEVKDKPADKPAAEVKDKK